MALQVELKPGERIVIGTAVLRNGESRTRFFIDGHAPILREKDILTANTADTPARRVYLAVQLMYLASDVTPHSEIYFELVDEFLAAAPSAIPYVADINNRISSGELYKALRSARQLIAYEQELMDHASGGGRLRQNSPDDAIAS